MTTAHRGAGSTAIVSGVVVDEVATTWPGRNQLMIALSRQVPVVLLEAAQPSQRLFDFRRPHLDRIDDNLFVMRNALALRTRRLGRRIPRISAVIDGYWFRKVLRTAGLADFVFWLHDPNPALTYGIPRSRLIYDCIDPNFFPNNQESFDRAEFEIAGRARVVFASARTLAARMRTVNNRVYLLPNAAPIAGSAPTHPPARPSMAPDSPVVGYLGTVDWRFDHQCVLDVATQLRDMNFLICGRVNADQERSVEALRKLPNVHFTGPLSPSDGESYLAAFDVAIIPFTPGQMNDAISPVKMFSYLQAGTPIVSTWIAECRENPLVLAARDSADFAEKVRVALETDSPEMAAARRVYADENTWAERANAALRILRTAGMVRP